MNRLTIRNSDGSVSQPMDLKWAEALERLAAYEDTGMEPEEIRTLKDGVCFGCSVPELKAHQLQIQEWERAEAEGRLVVLPCKLGGVVYGIHQGKTILPMVAKWFETNDGWTVAAQYPPMSPKFYRFADFGKTVFLRREGAEAALRKGETK